jgi:uncharacterized membrane protein YvbJ
MNQSLKPLLDRINSIKNYIVKHGIVISVVIIVLILTIMIYRISVLSNTQASTAEVDEAVKNLKIIRLDDNATKIVKELKDLSNGVEAKFDPSRSNPFQ